jgi:hypothetical protein
MVFPLLSSKEKAVWLGWAYLTKTVHKPQRGGVNLDPPMIFCACPMQNTPGASEMPQGDFRKKQKVSPSKRVLGAKAGCGDVTSLHKNQPSQKPKN